MSSYLRTSDISSAVGVHPNTVRLYETWGYLPPIPRSASGYRQFSAQHLEQMRLARLAFDEPFPGRRIRMSARKLVRMAATGELYRAHELALEHQALVSSELEQTRAAVVFLECWAAEPADSAVGQPLLTRKAAARALAVTAETLRHWERNGLISIPRDSTNNYRLYGPPEIDRLRVIRLLSRAGYSTMAMLRMVKRLDEGERDHLGRILDTPDPEEDLLSAGDRWLTTLSTHEERGDQILKQLAMMMDSS